MLFARRQLLPLIELGTLLVALTVIGATYLVLSGNSRPERLLTPPVVALLLVANLVPIIALMVFLARRIAKGRAARSPTGGNGRLHVRLVAIFSVIAAVPTLLVVIFASVLFQYGVEFWFSDKARTVLVNADRVARAYVAENRERMMAEIVPMAGDYVAALNQAPLDDPRFSQFFFEQLTLRNLSESALIKIGSDNQMRLLGGANLDKKPLEARLPRALLPALQNMQPYITTEAGDRIEAMILLDARQQIYLYASRRADPLVLAQAERAISALSDYNALTARTRSLQLQFNAALLIVSLLIVGAAIFIALRVADRLVRPVSELVGAARQVAGGDLSARVAEPRTQDEIGTLANAFNRMTRRLQEQTTTLESRRAFTEAVLSGVSAGVMSVDEDGYVRLVNTSASAFLRIEPEALVDRKLIEIAPALGQLLDGAEREVVAQLPIGGELRTLAVTLVRAKGGIVMTFDDITQQLLDQRRAAWSDVARRVAHEIKNPLTPIQLAAERLQRRYGKEIASDPGTFERLTATIVRQVGDLRRMVDEFSSFARMPKPVFRPESIVDIARQALFLHEVAHPGIAFSIDAPDLAPVIVCDRRQIAQALTNIVKNAVEAIEARGETGHVVMEVREEERRLVIEVADDGVGLPPERERITEPYMTTRARGTGLGLAIVRKIVEEHHGFIGFSDRPGGGTIVRLTLDLEALAPLAGADDLADWDEEQADLAGLTRTRIA